MLLIPLTLLPLQDDGFHLLVEVVLFDKNFKAVLDTGASKTVFDKNCLEKYVEKESIALSDHLSTGLGTNSMASYTLTLPELKIGELTIENYSAAVLDLSTINSAYESLALDPIIGVIGGDILQRYNALINYKDQTLKLFKEKSNFLPAADPIG